MLKIEAVPCGSSEFKPQRRAHFPVPARHVRNPCVKRAVKAEGAGKSAWQEGFLEEVMSELVLRG